MARQSIPNGPTGGACSPPVERLSDHGYSTMWKALRANDPSNEVLATYIVKEKLRGLLAPARRHPDAHQLASRFYRFLNLCAQVSLPEVLRLATTIEKWWPAIAAFIDTQITNARTEGYNRLVKRGQTICMWLSELRDLAPQDTIPLHS
ncbi:transposase [Gordonia liuliyuniae]|uniref:transposase n=1 Tax=Gordonia liuliyuniae TaxID=2911517 RepID=UPI002245EA4F|nr:transposase [Gordonia liuliyuniae]